MEAEYFSFLVGINWRQEGSETGVLTGDAFAEVETTRSFGNDRTFVGEIVFWGSLDPKPG